MRRVILLVVATFAWWIAWGQVAGIWLGVGDLVGTVGLWIGAVLLWVVGWRYGRVKTATS